MNNYHLTITNRVKINTIMKSRETKRMMNNWYTNIMMDRMVIKLKSIRILKIMKNIH